MQSYIGVLARTRVPLVDKKWTQLPKNLKDQIWEAKIVMSSAAKKWKDFKSTLTRQFILPFANEKEKLKEPPQLYNFIEKSQWDAFVASRLSLDFEVVHSEHNDILTLALGTPEHGGRARGVGAGVSPTQFFNLSRQQRVKFADKLKESVMEAVRKETKKMEARAKESVLVAVQAERDILLKQFSQLIPNFDPNLLCKTPITPFLQFLKSKAQKIQCLTKQAALILEPLFWRKTIPRMMLMLLKTGKMKQ
ncbi:unnamed protein product [Prunus brigantina]